MTRFLPTVLHLFALCGALGDESACPEEGCRDIMSMLQTKKSPALKERSLQTEGAPSKHKDTQHVHTGSGGNGGSGGSGEPVPVDGKQKSMVQVASDKSSYTPGVHADGVQSALETVFSEGGNLKQLTAGYEKAGMKKELKRACGQMVFKKTCPANAQCLAKKCICQDGFGTQDGKTCVSASKAKRGGNLDTGGTCGWFSCSASRGPTKCINTKCICADMTYANKKGKCVNFKSTAKGLAAARTAIVSMMVAGVREPDELTCPGDKFESGSMEAAIIDFHTRSNVSVCRSAVQVYHGSPLPLVPKKDLKHKPKDNGLSGADNAITDVYSLMDMRQWRTYLIKIMATEFVYAVLMPDLSEGAKRLGNLFHTLSDTFSGSHVQRTDPASSCEGLKVEMAFTMDVMNFVLHPVADMNKYGMLFGCAVKFEEAAIRLWAEARVKSDSSLAGVNKMVDRLVNEVFCPAFQMDDSLLDTPAGGASKTYAFSLKGLADGHKSPALPKGLAHAKDADRIIGGWREALKAQRASASAEKRRSIPHGLKLPVRGQDACKSPAAAHVPKKHLDMAKAGQLPPQYLMPRPL